MPSVTDKLQLNYNICIKLALSYQNIIIKLYKIYGSKTKLYKYLFNFIFNTANIWGTWLTVSRSDILPQSFNSKKVL